jgi:hypothetical protein
LTLPILCAIFEYYIMSKINSLFRAAISFCRTKKFFAILGLSILFVVGGGLVARAQIDQVTSQIQVPQIKNTIPEITNQEIRIEADSAFVLVENGEQHLEVLTNPYTVSLSKKEGKRFIRIYGIQQIGPLKMQSREFKEIHFTSDFSSPIGVLTTEIPNFVTDLQSQISFKVEEKDLQIFRDNSQIYPLENLPSTCTITAEFFATCTLDFKEKPEQILTYTIKDKAGNSTTIVNQKNVVYTPKPEINCDIVPLVNTEKTTLKCSSNKTGKLAVNAEEKGSMNSDNTLVLDVSLSEGNNSFTIKFTDDFGLSVEKMVSSQRDTIAPTLEFTSLPDAQKFQQGSFNYGVKASEDVSVNVQVDPYNDYFENTKGIKIGEKFGYYGAVSFNESLTANVSQNLNPKNSAGSCQLIDLEYNSPDTINVSQDEYNQITKDWNTQTAWFNAHPGKALSVKQKINPQNRPIINGKECNLYNGLFSRTTLTLTDKAGNSSQYFCTNFIYTDNDKLVKDGKSKCSKNKEEIHCGLFANYFKRV